MNRVFVGKQVRIPGWLVNHMRKNCTRQALAKQTSINKELDPIVA